ncbi:hypothetical protein Dsin_022883 [Dipteronia sinensis]|uniref:Glyoxal oxidase N-terminal domain-containing protein n=1 Tax=Dipteronia sinensis TaxID=43782 RepID=A0AAE0A288_9ROSI|nr:hypothetical protein Dsin_022883 [Dipteronia sinensis]
MLLRRRCGRGYWRQLTEVDDDLAGSGDGAGIGDADGGVLDAEKVMMPSPKVMTDMLLLPTGDVLMINGAKRGTVEWDFADDQNTSMYTTPVLYKPDNPKTQRFT